MNEQSVAKYLAERLPELGITHVFELAGGMITLLLDAMHEHPGLQVVSMHHEQGAGFAAEGFSRQSNSPAVAMATSGPGATNLLTAIGSCYFDSIPVIFVTGQVNRGELGLGRVGRQGGFQETDIVKVAGPLTKFAAQIGEVSEFPFLLEKAVRTACEGRPGPVLLDIPMDVQKSLLSPQAMTGPTGQQVEGVGSDRIGGDLTAGTAKRAEFVTEFLDSLAEATKPLVLVGGGIRGECAKASLRAVLRATALPAVHSLLGLDVLPASSPERIGLIGSYGNRWANRAVAEADLLLVLGSRLDVRQTGSDIDGFRGNRKIFHVDIDATELNTRVPGCKTLNDNVKDFIQYLQSVVPGPLQTDDWLRTLAHWEVEAPDTLENLPKWGLNPNEVVAQLSDAWLDVSAWVTDVGQHQMWAAQSLRIREGQRFHTSGGMGSMGFGLPAAIGAALASPGRPVALIAGDGGFQCNVQELESLRRMQLPVRIIVMDNKSHGMVRQFQQSYFNERYHSTRWGYSAPDFVKLANAYGIPAFHVADQEGFIAALASIEEQRLEPVLIHMEIDPDLNVYPKMAFGMPFGSMEPQVRPTEMEST